MRHTGEVPITEPSRANGVEAIMIYLQHAVMALAAQALLGLTTGNWWAGAALGSAYFVGREVAQAEYRWIEWFGKGRRANMPHWGR